MAIGFEGLAVWQLARILVKEIFTLTRTETFRKYYSLTDQVQRASLSVMNNISEGFERQSNKEFVYFLKIAKGSCGEVRSILYVLINLDLISKVQFQHLHDQTISISKSLAGFITYLNNNTISKPTPPNKNSKP
jgi:four helix bundle protein